MYMYMTCTSVLENRGVGLIPFPTCISLFFLAVFSSPSVSGSEERGAEAALPPSASADAVAASNSLTVAKLGNGQSLRVRLDSYPAGK